MELVYGEEVFRIVGAAIEVHRELGAGFFETVYQEALELEMLERMIPFSSQHGFRIRYKKEILRREYVADLVCWERIIVELKALDRLTSREESQVLNYLKASEMRVGVLINFGSYGKLEWKRFVR